MAFFQPKMALNVQNSQIFFKGPVLSKQPLSTADRFFFNIGNAKKTADALNYEVLENRKDGDAFTAKYNSH